MQHVTKLKRLVIFLLAFVMIAAPVGASAATTYQKGSRTYNYSGSSYTVYYNSRQVNTKKKTGVLIDGSIMIPYKACLVKRGPQMNAKYNKSSGKLVLSYEGTKVKLFVGKKKIKVNGVKKKISVAPLFVKFNGKKTLVVPARALFEEGFGFNYEYKKKKKAVYITEPETTTNSAPAEVPAAPQTGGMTAAAFANMSTTQFIQTMGPIAQADYKKSGVLASVTLAQAILESGWGKSELAQKGNNLFGMKTNLSGNTWSGSVWDGYSSVTINTGEEYGGKHVTISAPFRKYSCVEQSVADHSAYLVNAKDGYSYRYAGLTSTNSYKKQLTIIKNGGYATSSTYVSQLTSLIERYNLDQYDR